MSHNSDTEFIVAFSTAGSPEEALRIATALVGEQLAATLSRLASCLHRRFLKSP
jgi:uncharacterized protein involved in tolerance to divalent cations